MNKNLQIGCDDIVVVGAGLFGLVIARQIAVELGKRVVILERRHHIGGNVFSEVDRDTGIEVHKYGSHLFHTSNQRVWDYVNTFSEFNNYTHHVMTVHDGVVYPMPIGLGTINSFFRSSMGPDEARRFLQEQAAAVKGDPDANLESRAISLIGRPLYDAFIREYTHKQWQTDPTQLSADIIKRLPIRFTYEQKYFSDTWEGLPLCGYTELVRRIADHPLIDVQLDCDFFEVRNDLPDSALMVYSGPIDHFFDYRFGVLGWRTLDFEFEKVPLADYQGTSVMNYADADVPFTRIHEFRHLHPEREMSHEASIIAREYSRFAEVGDEPYYPINSQSDREIIRAYREAAKLEKNVIFGGRLGSYHYLDMHMAIAAALNAFESEIRPRFSKNDKEKTNV
jgi:UDP-galactopyranose mutase